MCWSHLISVGWMIQTNVTPKGYCHSQALSKVSIWLIDWLEQIELVFQTTKHNTSSYRYHFLKWMTSKRRLTRDKRSISQNAAIQTPTGWDYQVHDSDAALINLTASVKSLSQNLLVFFSVGESWEEEGAVRCYECIIYSITRTQSIRVDRQFSRVQFSRVHALESCNQGVLKKFLSVVLSAGETESRLSAGIRLPSATLLPCCFLHHILLQYWSRIPVMQNSPVERRHLESLSRPVGAYGGQWWVLWSSYAICSPMRCYLLDGAFKYSVSAPLLLFVPW